MGWLEILQLASVASLSLALIPAGAHLFELPNKMALDDASYMVVQKIYAGWALFGIVIFASIGLTLAHAAMVWRRPRAVIYSIAACLGIGLTQIVFWQYTHPINALTQNWTVTPADIDTARSQWELSHAVNAGITFMSLVFQVFAVLASRDGTITEIDGSQT